MANITRDKSTGLERLIVQTDDGAAEIYLHGAHVTRFHPRGQKQPVLWMSGKSFFRHDKAIRGGVPICFPWFGPKTDDPKAPQHGFARLSEFVREKVEPHDDSVTITLLLRSGEHLHPSWPHRFEARQIVTVGSTLKMEFRVTNIDSAPFKYEAALHSYFHVGDIHQVEIHGVTGKGFSDRLRPGEMFIEGASPIRFSGTFDRTYFNTEDPVTIVDKALDRTIINRKSGSRSTVIWNPWEAKDKSKAAPDFDDDGWRSMVCVETANAGENAIELPAGESHSMSAEIDVTSN